MVTENLIAVLTIVLLIAFSSYFSAAETAFSSLNRIRIKTAAEAGDKRSALVLRLLEGYDKTLGTILIGNNIVNIAMASISTLLFVRWFGANGVTISTIVITVLVLIFGEITPKTLARDNAEAVARFSAPVVQVLNLLFTPVNLLFGLWKRLLNRLFKSKREQSITEAELRSLVEEAEEEGAIQPDDADMIESAFAFNDSRVQDIFTPRVEIEAVPEDVEPEELARVFVGTGYTRIPVYRESLDDIVGVVLLHDFFAAGQGAERPLASYMMPVQYVSPFTPINRLLKLLQSSKNHLAVVADEYGGTLGIVTMEDILEELVGEIWDEHDEIQQPIRQLAGGRYAVAGSADIEEVFALFGLEEDVDCATVSGWITQCLGRLPLVGDSFTQNGLTVEVTAATARLVEEAVVSPADVPPGDESREKAPGKE